MLVQKQNLEMICDPSDYFIHVSEAGEDRKQLSVTPSDYCIEGCVFGAWGQDLQTGSNLLLMGA